jgi:hypothetical protein
MSKHKKFSGRKGWLSVRATNGACPHRAVSFGLCTFLIFVLRYSHRPAGYTRQHLFTPPPRRFARLSIATRTTFCPIKQTARFGAVNKFLGRHLLCLLKPIAVAREPLWPGPSYHSELVACRLPNPQTTQSSHGPVIRPSVPRIVRIRASFSRLDRLPTSLSPRPGPVRSPIA